MFFLIDFAEVAHVRKEYDESSAKLSKIQSRISSLTQKLKQDFGISKTWTKTLFIVILFTSTVWCAISVGLQCLHFNTAGPEKEFYSFYGQCFETKQNKLEIFLVSFSHHLFLSHQVPLKTNVYNFSYPWDLNYCFRYVYKVCPFKQATQEEGYSTTRLG